ncbi:hypothetical protein [Mesorhizobium sp.]|nr:hypothetical protein [Mesorhizobium sp.]
MLAPRNLPVILGADEVCDFCKRCHRLKARTALTVYVARLR